VRGREETERWEAAALQPRASRSAESRGRAEPEPDDPLRTAFQRDRDRIVHAKAFRRLMHKTQVFLAPEGDHYRTRLTHTLEVAQIARTIARALRLNEDLTEAISLAHDLGHPPFGHAGEAALNEAMAPWGGFRHDQQSLRVVDRLEHRNRTDGSTVAGLNLTWEVRDGIACHSKGLRDLEAAGEEGDGPSTQEGRLVRAADRVAYLHHDTDDAIRAGMIREADIPRKITAVLGEPRARWLDAIVHDIVSVASSTDAVDLSAPMRETLNGLKDFLAEEVYLSAPSRMEAERGRRMLRLLFDHFTAHPGEIPGDPMSGGPAESPYRAACDFVAGMTDRYAIRAFAGLFMVAGIDGG